MSGALYLFSLHAALTNHFLDSVLIDTVPKVIDFPRYSTKCSGENEILRGIYRVLSRFPLNFMYIFENFNYFFGQCICS